MLSMEYLSSDNLNLSDSNIKLIEKGYSIALENYNSNLIEIESIIKKSKISSTLNLIKIKLKKITDLKICIESTLELDQIYSAKILLRSLLEHKLIAHYVWLKSDQDKNDNCANSYYTEYSQSEKIKQESYYLKAEGIKLNNKNNTSFDKLKSRLDFLKDKTQTELENIHKIGNQFSIIKIANYLNNELDSNSPFQPYIKNAIINDLLEYNLLSSFVHGGPYSENQAYGTIANKKNERERRKTYYQALHSTKSILMILFGLLRNENPKYGLILKQILDARK